MSFARIACAPNAAPAADAINRPPPYAKSFNENVWCSCSGSIAAARFYDTNILKAIHLEGVASHWSRSMSPGYA